MQQISPSTQLMESFFFLTSFMEVYDMYLKAVFIPSSEMV